MKHWIIVLLAGAMFATAAIARAGEDEALVAKRLEDAQRRLEDAAREVADLSGQAFVPNPRRAMLGVNLGEALPGGGGVYVEGVSPGGPAQEAGVKAGDVIVAVAAKPVTTGRELVHAMETVKPGDKVELGLLRDGKSVKVSVEARPLDHLFFVATPGVPGVPAVRALPPIPALPALAMAPFEGDMHWLLEDWGDAEFVTMTPGLGHYFGTDKGVLVARAPEDAALGLKDGDVVVSIGGREPQNGRHAMRILRSYQPGEAVEIKILRDHHAQTLSAKIPERDDRDAMHRTMAPRAPVMPVPAPRPPPAPESAATS